jgi:hypothetical protein
VVSAHLTLLWSEVLDPLDFRAKCREVVLSESIEVTSESWKRVWKLSDELPNMDILISEWLASKSSTDS